MRQRWSDRRVHALRKELGLPIRYVLVRGGTDHRIDLYLEGGKIAYYDPDTGKIQHTDYAWSEKYMSNNIPAKPLKEKPDLP